MLLVGMDKVPHVSDVVVNYTQKVTVWVGHVVAIARIINHKVFPDIFDSLCEDVGRGIIGKREISGREVFERLFSHRSLALYLQVVGERCGTTWGPKPNGLV